jgi:hypothetical protein
MKRVWRVAFPNPQPFYIPNVITDGSCYICGRKLELGCSSCCNTMESEFKKYAKYIFMLLHVLQKRPGSLFYMMDKHILAMIIQRALTLSSINSPCSVIALQCDHTFHRHCFTKYLKTSNDNGKVLKCPLDISSEIVPVSVKHIKRDSACAKITIWSEIGIN